MAGLIFCPNHYNFLHINNNKSVSLSYHLCVHWNRTLNFPHEFFLYIHNLANCLAQEAYLPVSAFDMTSSLSFIISRLCFITEVWGFPDGSSTCQCRRCWRCQFDPCVRKIPWRRKWQPTPIFLPGKSHGQRSLAGCSPWGCKRVRHD